MQCPRNRGKLTEPLGASDLDPFHAVAAHSAAAAVNLVSASTVNLRPNEDPDRSEAYIIDVLFVYEPLAKKSWKKTQGGDIGALAQAMIDYANTVFSNNELNLTLNLKHIEVLPKEALDAAFDSDSWYRPIHHSTSVNTLRSKHQADVVFTLVRGSWDRNCGSATIWANVTISGNPYPADMHSRYAFGWVAVGPANKCQRIDPIETFVHELGHTLGGWHESADYSKRYPATPMFDYAFGWKNKSQKPHVSTVMVSWPIKDDVVPFFSSATRAYEGLDIGSRQADMEETILRTRADVSKFDTHLHPVPAAPTELVATEMNGPLVELTWTDNATNEGRYEILYKPLRVGDGWYKFRTVGRADSTKAYLRSNFGVLWLGRTYDIKIRAASGYVASDWSNTVTVGPIGRPVAPSGLIATPTSDQSGSVDLSWADNSDNETGFLVRYRCLCGGGWSERDLTADTTEMVITGLTAGKTYRVRVKAVNQYGESPRDQAKVKLPD